MARAGPPPGKTPTGAPKGRQEPSTQQRILGGPTQLDGATQDGTHPVDFDESTSPGQTALPDDDVFASVTDLPADEGSSTDTHPAALVQLLVVNPGHARTGDLAHVLEQAGVVPVVVETAAAAVEELRTGIPRAVLLVVGNNVTWANNLLAMANQRFPGTPMVVWAPEADRPDVLLGLVDAGAVDALGGSLLSAGALRVWLQGIIPELEAAPAHEVIGGMAELRARQMTALRGVLDRIPVLDAKVVELQAQLAATQQDSARQLKAWHQKAAAAETNATRSTQENARRVSEVQKAQADVAAAQAKTAAAEARAAELQARLDGLGAELQSARTELAKHAQDLVQVQTEMQLAQSGVTGLETDLTAANDRVVQLESQHKEMRAAADAAREREAAAEERARAAEQRAIQAEGREVQAASSAATALSEAQDAVARANAADGRAEEAARAAAEARAAAQEAQVKAQEADAARSKATADLQRRERDVLRLQQQLAETAKEAAQSRVSLARITARTDEAERQVKAVQQRAEQAAAGQAAAREELAQAESRISSFQATLEEARRDLEDAHARTADRDAHAANLQADLDLLREELTRWQATSTAQEAAIQTLRQKLGAQQEALDSAQSTARGALSRADQAEVLVRKTLGDADRQLDRIKELTTQLVSAREHAAAVQADAESVLARGASDAAQLGHLQAALERAAQERDAALEAAAAAQAGPNAEILALRQALDTQRSQLESHIQDRSRLEADSDAVRGALDVLRQQVAQLLDEKRQLETGAAAILPEVRNILGGVASYENALEAVVDFLKHMQASGAEVDAHVRNAQLVRGLVQRLAGLTGPRPS